MTAATDAIGFYVIIGSLYGLQVPSRDCHVGLRPPRNDKSGSLAPQNVYRSHCQPARRSLSAATDAIGFYVFSMPCTNCHCLPEIATGAKRPRNDKSENLAPLNLCHDHCRSAWRSLSAATDAIGAYHFNDSLYELQVPSRDCHVGFASSQ